MADILDFSHYEIKLVNGSGEGIVVITKPLWSVSIYKIPRIRYTICRSLLTYKDFMPLSYSGVYFLIGTQAGHNTLYIGQAGERSSNQSILARIAEHDRSSDKDFFKDLIFITNSAHDFGPTEVDFLEQRFWQLATECRNYIVHNKVKPNSHHFRDSITSSLEASIVTPVKSLMRLLGYEMFEPQNLPVISPLEEPVFSHDKQPSPCSKPVSAAAPENNKNSLFEIHIGKGGRKAQCLRLPDSGFVVLKGSLLRIGPSTLTSLPKKYASLRQSLIEKGELILLHSDIYRLEKDQFFYTSSAAATFVLGFRAGGAKHLIHTATGKTLQDYLSSLPPKTAPGAD